MALQGRAGARAAVKAGTVDVHIRVFVDARGITRAVVDALLSHTPTKGPCMAPDTVVVFSSVTDVLAANEAGLVSDEEARALLGFEPTPATTAVAAPAVTDPTAPAAAGVDQTVPYDPAAPAA